MLRNYDLFTEGTKTVPKSLEEAYREMRKFVNLDKELGLDKNNKVAMKVAPRKEKRRISQDRVSQDKRIDKTKHFTSNHRASGQWLRNKRPYERSLSPFMGQPLRVSLAQVVLRMKEEHNVRWLPKMKALPRDTFKWCAFPKDLGHKMRDYGHIKKQI